MEENEVIREEEKKTTEITEEAPEKVEEEAVEKAETEEIQEGSEGKEKPSKEKKSRPLVHDFFDYIVDIVVTSVVAAVFLLTLIVRTGYVDGESMAPTMLDGDRYLVSGLFYTPKQGDIIVFQPEINELTLRAIHDIRDNRKLLVKRVIATEGQVVDIDAETRQVLVDGVVLSEPYLSGNITDKRPDANINYPYTVPSGHVFVLGDNRTASVDSRQIGSIDIRTILGNVIVRFFPFDKIGEVN